MEAIGSLAILIIVISALCGMTTAAMNGGKADWFLVARPLFRGTVRLPGRVGGNLSHTFFGWARQLSRLRPEWYWYFLIVPTMLWLWILGAAAYGLTIPGQIFLGGRR